jgi:hypothetical protein
MDDAETLMGSERQAGAGKNGSGPQAARRPENKRLRELVDEMLATVRVAAGHDLWTPEERQSAGAELDKMLGDTMRRLRREVMHPGATQQEASSHWRTPLGSRSISQGDASPPTRRRLRLRKEVDALLDAVRIAASPVNGPRGRWESRAERAAYERQLERIMAAVRAEAMSGLKA